MKKFFVLLSTFVFWPIQVTNRWRWLKVMLGLSSVSYAVMVLMTTDVDWQKSNPIIPIFIVPVVMGYGFVGFANFLSVQQKEGRTTSGVI